MTLRDLANYQNCKVRWLLIMYHSSLLWLLPGNNKVRQLTWQQRIVRLCLMMCELAGIITGTGVDVELLLCFNMFQGGVQ
jgi:hypothetical protein